MHNFDTKISIEKNETDTTAMMRIRTVPSNDGKYISKRIRLPFPGHIVFPFSCIQMNPGMELSIYGPETESLFSITNFRFVSPSGKLIYASLSDMLMYGKTEHFEKNAVWKLLKHNTVSLCWKVRDVSNGDYEYHFLNFKDAVDAFLKFQDSSLSRCIFLPMEREKMKKHFGLNEEDNISSFRLCDKREQRITFLNNISLQEVLILKEMTKDTQFNILEDLQTKHRQEQISEVEDLLHEILNKFFTFCGDDILVPGQHKARIMPWNVWPISWSWFLIGRCSPVPDFYQHVLPDGSMWLPFPKCADTWTSEKRKDILLQFLDKLPFILLEIE